MVVEGVVEMEEEMEGGCGVGWVDGGNDCGGVVVVRLVVLFEDIKLES